MEVDFIPIKSFNDVVVFNVDGLFYNFSKGKFIANGFEHFLEKKKIECVNNSLLHPDKDKIAKRVQKLQNFADWSLAKNNYNELVNDLKNPSLFEKNLTKFNCDKSL